MPKCASPDSAVAAQQQQAAASLSALIESTEDLIWSVDLNFALLTFNGATQRHLERNFGSQAAIGDRPEDVLPSERAALWPTLYRRALSQGPFRIEVPFPNGRTLEISLNPIVADGKTTGISVFGRDIAEERAAEEARASLATLIETSEDAIIATDLSGAIVSWNRGAQQLLGYTSEEILGKQLSILIIPSHEEHMRGNLKALGKSRSVQSFDTRLCHKDGRWIDVSLSISPICDAEGKVVGTAGIARDIRPRKRFERELQEAEKKYRDIFDGALEGLFQSSLECKFITANPSLAKMLGYSSPDELMTSVQDLAHNVFADPEDHVAFRNRLDEQGTVRDLEYRLRRKDGEAIWGAISCRIVNDPNGSIAHFEGSVIDIAARKHAEMKLRESEERYRTVFQTSLDAILISRAKNGKIIDVNQAFLDALGFERDEVIGRTTRELNLWEDSHDRDNLLNSLSRTSECRNMEIQFRRRSGETLWALVSASIIEIDGEHCVLAIARDISNAKAAEDEIRNLAFYDPLTGLPNRRLLLERLHQALAASNRTGRMRALLFVDLDNFKTLNDTLGHQTGDLLLQEAARRLRTCVRDTDTVGRLGGDEFVLMLEDLSELPEDAAAQSKAVAEKILAALGQPFPLAGREYSSSASIGISVFGDCREGTNEVLQQADIAMYQAKLAGRNTMRFFAPALQAAVNAHATMEEELRQGIKSSQFVLYYQPQIDRNRLVGAEALIRWNHPRRSVLLAGEFIPMAEDTRLILPLGKWVLQAACEQIAAWADRRQTARLSVAVNISASQFRQPDFVQQVLSALDSTGANPRNLGLELTESMLVENIEEVIEKMKELKSHGLRFSLDDFGTGFSSLAYLKRLPLSQLKIDRSFIRDILTDESSAAIAQTIVSLSRAMGLPVVAEGVETEEQREFLTRIGCHAFQGYTFSRPLPLEEFESQWLPPVRSAAQAAR